MSKRSNIVLLAIVITAAIVTPLVLAGVYLGYYVGGIDGVSGSIMAIALSTAGFLLAMVIDIKAITWLAAREQSKS